MHILFKIFLMLLLASPVFAATRLDDEGVKQGYINAIDCVGAGISCSKSGITGTISVSGGGASDVTAAANLGDNLLIRGDGALKAVQNSGISIDDSDNVTGINDLTTSGGININLPADDSIVIDGSTNQRTIDTGLFQITQTPTIENTRAINIILDINSQATSHAQVTNVIATGLAPGETATAYDTNVDRSTSTGGVIRGYEMSIAGAGTAVGHLMHADPGIVPLTQFSGAFINVEQAWDENGGFTDVTTAFNSTGTDVTLFNANSDMVHIGMAVAFNQIRVNLATVAGGAGIKPVFEYSSGGGTPVWTVFTPQDETQGFKQSQVINWNIDDLVTPTWAVATINGVSKFYIRITRTQASIPTDPIEDTIQVVTAIVYSWDENGRIFAGSVITGKRTNTVTTEGNSETSQMIAHIDNGFSETIEHTLMRHSDTANIGSILYGIRSRGSHASQATVQDNDTVFQLKVSGYDGTDYNNLASIFFEVDGTPGANDMPGRIVLSTSADGSNALVEALRIDSTQRTILGGTTGVALSAASGVFTMQGVGGSNDEDLTFDFESIPNWVTLGTTEGVSNFDFGTLSPLVRDNERFKSGNGEDFAMVWSTTGNHNQQIGTKVADAAFSGYISIMELADLGNANRSPTASSVFGATSANPVFAWYSSDETQAGDMGGCTHDQTDTRCRGGNGRFILDTIANNDSFVIANDGLVGIGVTPTQQFHVGNGSAFLIDGLTDPIFTLRDQNVNHGITSLSVADGDTNTMFHYKIANGAIGGVEQVALTDADGVTPLKFLGVFGVTDPTDTLPGIILSASKKVTTNDGDIADTETILQINNHQTPKITVLGSGNFGIGTVTPDSELHVIGGVCIEASDSGCDSADGTVTVGVGLDGIGAVDLDIGSADVLDVTVTTDGGIVILDGTIVASSSITAGASATPSLIFDDSDDAGSEDVSIRGNCPTLNDCDLTLGVNSGADTDTVMIKLDTTDAGATTVQLGDPAGGNYINITEAGVMTAVGTASIPGSSDTNSIKLYTWSASGTIPTKPSAAEFDGVATLSQDTGTNQVININSYDDTDDECRGVVFKIPEDVDTSGSAQFHITWYSKTATSGNVVWYITWHEVNEGESWDSTTTDDDGGANDTVQGTVDLVTETTFSETMSDLGWTADETVTLWFCRDGDGDKFTDDLVGDAEAISYAIEIPRS